MKTHPRFVVLILASLVLLSSPLAAQAFYGSDNFNDNTFASGRWGSFNTANAGLWTETNGRMEFTGDATSTSITTSNRVQQFRVWSNNTASSSYTDSWTASASFTIDTAAVSSNGVVMMGLETFAATTTAGYYGVYLLSATSGSRIFAERGIWNGTGYTRATLGSTGDLNLSFDTTNVLLETRYNPSTNTLTTAFSFDGGTTYYDFTTGGGTNAFGGGASFTVTNWAASATDGFGLDIYGALYGNGTQTGPTLTSGQAYMDNLSVSAVPEPSTYAALAGLGALGLAIWRRRRATKPNAAKPAHNA